MGKRDRYRDDVDPETQRWGRRYRSFPGVAECVRLILAGKARGTWADIIVAELAENASKNLNETVNAFREHKSDDVGMYVLMALEIAALPASVEFLSSVLHEDNPQFARHADRALRKIDTRESRSALFHAKKIDETPPST
jgi:hypothetical protein